MAKISVIIPVYNVADYVDRCLRSVTGQTFPDIEIIVINDGSTDDSGARCLEWAKRDTRIVYVSKKNEGAGPARNLGIKMATADFVAFCDPDDWYDEMFVEKMLAKQLETGADMVVCGWHRYDGYQERVVESVYLDGDKFLHQDIEWRWSLRPAIWLKIIRKSIFDKHDIRMPAGFAQDTAIHYYLMTKVEILAVVCDPLCFNFFNREGSATNNYIGHTSNTVNYLEHICSLFIQDNSFEKYRDSLFVRAMHMIYGWHNKLSEAKEYRAKWYADSIASFSRHFSDIDKVLGLNVSVLGSYSLSTSVTFTNRESTKKYCFTGLLSYMSIGAVDAPKHGSHFRQEALEADFKKTFLQNLQDEKHKIDFLILDFLDERYGLAEINGEFYTNSDAFMDVGAIVPHTVRCRHDKNIKLLWNERCLRFIESLKKRLEPHRVILVRNYLTSTYKAEGKRQNFDNQAEIILINRLLEDCYNFFESNFSGINVIDINNMGLSFTDKYFRYGCVPWHYNHVYYTKLRVLILEALESGLS